MPEKRPFAVRVLGRAFFERSAILVAQELLGKYIIRCQGKKLIARMITETEAYVGPEDRACHAHRGKTQRNAPMFGPGGRWYVYFCYGVHWMLNIVTCERGYPAAVLIRGIEGASGPGRLTKTLGVDRSFNALPATVRSGLWIEDRGVEIPRNRIKRGPRVGVDYAGSWAKKPYRFILRGPGEPTCPR